MPTAYEVTAGNRYFYQRLVVLADNPDAAHDLFTAYLAAPEQQGVEEEEWEMGMAIYDDTCSREVIDRDNYCYSFLDSDLREFTSDPHWHGTPTTDVQVMQSGGNG